MTKAEALVHGNPNWTKIESYYTGVSNYRHNVHVYKHKTGATLQCDSYHGRSLLNMYGNTEDIERSVSILDAYGLL